MTLSVDLIQRCLVDLSESSDDIGTVANAFFERESPDLTEDERLRLLYVAYEFSWERTETLQESARRCGQRASDLGDLDLIREAFWLRDLSRQYLDIFKRLGPYLIGKNELEAQARPN